MVQNVGTRGSSAGVGTSGVRFGERGSTCVSGGWRQGHDKCHGEGFGLVAHRCPTSGGRRRWIAIVPWRTGCSGHNTSHLCDEMAHHMRVVLAKMAPPCSEPAAGKNSHTLNCLVNMAEPGWLSWPVRWGAGGLPRRSHSFGSWPKPRPAICLAFSGPVRGWRGCGGGA